MEVSIEEEDIGGVVKVLEVVVEGTVLLIVELVLGVEIEVVLVDGDELDCVGVVLAEEVDDLESVEEEEDVVGFFVVCDVVTELLGVVAGLVLVLMDDVLVLPSVVVSDEVSVLVVDFDTVDREPVLVLDVPGGDEAVVVTCVLVDV